MKYRQIIMIVTVRDYWEGRFGLIKTNNSLLPPHICWISKSLVNNSLLPP